MTDEVDKSNILDMMTEARKIESKRKQALRGAWSAQLLRNTRGNITGAFANVVLILRNDEKFAGCLAYDEFTNAPVVVKPLPWDKQEGFTRRVLVWGQDDQDIRLALGQWPYEVAVGAGDCVEAIERVCRDNPVHVVADWLNGLEWDGTPRIEQFFIDYLDAADSLYTRKVSRMFFIQAVARAMQPGCEAHGVLVLEGEQRIGKSTIFKILGSPWFSDTAIAIGTRTGYATMAGVWIRELPEFVDVLKLDPAEAKAFFTQSTDTYIPPYGRKPITVRRSGVCVGTYNPTGTGMLNDPTGGGRYWPVVCKAASVDFDSVRAVKDQLWAEATAAYKAGESWWLTRDSEEFDTVWDEQESRYVGDVWEDIIRQWAIGRGEFTMREVLNDCLELTIKDMQKPAQTRVGTALKRLGFVRKERRINGILHRYYTVTTTT